MEIIFAALLAGKALLPAIDRESLDLQARAEALRPRTDVSRPRGETSRPRVKAQRPATVATSTRASSRCPEDASRRQRTSRRPASWTPGAPASRRASG